MLRTKVVSEALSSASEAATCSVSPGPWRGGKAVTGWFQRPLLCVCLALREPRAG